MSIFPKCLSFYFRQRIIILSLIHISKRAGFGKVVFVIKKAIEKDFKETVGARVPEGMEVCYAYQEVDALPEGYNVPEGRVKPWGTAHAVLCAKPFIN